LETERGGINVYTAAISAVTNEDLRQEFSKYLEETQRHEALVTDICNASGIDPEAMTPGRTIVRHQGESLVEAIEMAVAAGDPTAAQIVAAECVVLAETKDHQNWELIGTLVEKGDADLAKLLKPAFDEVEQQEDHHYYHTKGWVRELWIESLGFPAVLPPPEEVKDVETAIGASRAEKAREKML
jgi:rubrerythrin